VAVVAAAVRGVLLFPAVLVVLVGPPEAEAEVAEVA
jgi:hypothetical protein